MAAPTPAQLGLRKIAPAWGRRSRSRLVTWSLKNLEIRAAFASVSVLSLSAAVAWRMLDPASAHCLQTATQGAPHCVFCWVAIMLAGMAAAPDLMVARFASSASPAKARRPD